MNINDQMHSYINVSDMSFFLMEKVSRLAYLIKKDNRSPGTFCNDPNVLHFLLEGDRETRKENGRLEKEEVRGVGKVISSSLASSYPDFVHVNVMVLFLYFLMIAIFYNFYSFLFKLFCISIKFITMGEPYSVCHSLPAISKFLSIF